MKWLPELSTWIRTQLEIHKLGIEILFILSAIVSILGVNMASFNIFSTTILEFLLVLNTIITFIAIKWRSIIINKEKDLLIKARDELTRAQNLTGVIVGTKRFVVGELIVKWSEGAPLSGISKDQAEAISLYKKAISNFEENLNQI